ncbi:hypothetical protein DEAC_c23710 [Desulfosporosinus acididurans]|uniref:Uncharacterized protein n=1 Tax=Desulfosporosinus acididurans TaxID=476652 RepID=A0A0J1IM06_9FIRM|nr:hypothetical protein [Desulfosporosinus acididurans]KLU65741.1 hypothetical protein DEAC_c23710 [Desulfosporosinus acididurans]
MQEQDFADLATRIAILETKGEAQESRLNSLEIDVGKKFDRLEAKLDQLIDSSQGRPTWTITLSLSALMTIATSLIVYLVSR